MAITYSQTVNVPPNLFDRLGNVDITIALSNWLNDTNNVPHGPSATVHTRVLFPRFQANGTSRALYRIEGGVSGAGCVLGANLVNVTIDGGGTPGNQGLDGCQFIQKLQLPYTSRADPTTNPRGVFKTDGRSSAANNTLTANTDLSFLHVNDDIQFLPRIDKGWLDTKTYAFDDRVTSPDDAGNARMYQSLFGNNLNHKPLLTGNDPWWRRLGRFPDIRKVTAVNVGGNPNAINYDGQTLGNYLGPPLVDDTAHEYMVFATQPNDDWNALYTPTNTINVTFNGENANGTAYERAKAKAKGLNKGRSFWLWNKCTHLRFAHMQCSGSNNTSSNIEDLEGQDGIKFNGVDDCMIDDCTIEDVWGNGFQVLPYFENNGDATASIGVWIFDSHIHGCGRQCGSIQFGGPTIIENSKLNSSARTLLDSEPVASFSRKDPRLDAVVQGIFLYNMEVGHHGLGGIISLHPNGIQDVHIKGCFGLTIGSGSTWGADNIIYEHNDQTGGSASSSVIDIARGGIKPAAEWWGGRNIWVHDNTNMDTNDVVVHLHASNIASVTGPSNGVHTNTLTGAQQIAVDDTTQYPSAGTCQVGTGGGTTLSWTQVDNTHLKNVTGHGPDKVLLTGMTLPMANGCQNYKVTNNTGQKTSGGPVPQLRDDHPIPWSGTFVPFTLTPVHAMRDAVSTQVVVNGAQAVVNVHGWQGTASVIDTSQYVRRYVIQ